MGSLTFIWKSDFHYSEISCLVNVFGCKDFEILELLGEKDGEMRNY